MIRRDGRDVPRGTLPGKGRRRGAAKQVGRGPRSVGSSGGGRGGYDGTRGGGGGSERLVQRIASEAGSIRCSLVPDRRGRSPAQERGSSGAEAPAGRARTVGARRLCIPTVAESALRESRIQGRASGGSPARNSDANVPPGWHDACAPVGPPAHRPEIPMRACRCRQSKCFVGNRRVRAESDPAGLECCATCRSRLFGTPGGGRSYAGAFRCGQTSPGLRFCNRPGNRWRSFSTASSR